MNIDAQQIPQHDGASQAGRRLPALDPASVPIDERSVTDLLRFAREYGRELRYFNTRDEADGDWAEFLDGDLDALARFLDDPERFRAEAPGAPPVRPHVVLFLTFLDLLQTAKAQLNDLTRRHLEFYYREALRLSARPAAPDRVHVLVELVDEQREWRLPAGSLLVAGQDPQGADVLYRTDHDLTVNQARVAELKTLFVKRQVIGIREAQQNFRLVAELFPAVSATWSDPPFMAMLSLALGVADPGGALPSYPPTGAPPSAALFTDLDTLIASVRAELAMSPAVFRSLMELKRARDAATAEWAVVNALLQQAGARRDPGFTLSDAAPRDFEANLLRALGRDAFGTFFDTLPEVDDIYDLYRLRERPDVRAFVEDARSLFMPFDDFVQMMAVVDSSYKDWRRIYDLLRTAARRKHPGAPLPPPDLRAYEADKFAALLHKTIGEYGVPPLTTLQVAGLDDVYAALLNLEAYFAMPVEEYAALREINARATAQPWEWERVYALLDQSYAARRLPARLQRLQSAHTAGGFDRLIRTALGEPAPGDPLPEARQFMALDAVRDEPYVREQLYLELANFSFIQRSADRPLDDPVWATVYRMLELAERRKRGWEAPRPQLERWENVYAAADATRVLVQSGPTSQPVTPRWRAFGAPPDQSGQSSVVPAAGGLALASPLLALAEGERTIALTLEFSPEHFDRQLVDQALALTPPVLRVSLSTPEALVEVAPGPALRDTPPAVAITAGQSSAADALPTLEIVVRLGAQAPPVAPLTADGGIRTSWPMLQLRLSALTGGGDLVQRAFGPLRLERVALAVTAAGIADLTLQNDGGVIDPKQPFEPFGFAPVVGSSFAFAHPELCAKQLDALTLQIDWLGAPDNFSAYYRGYSGFEEPTAPPASPIADNTAFRAQLRLYDSRARFDVAQIQLVHADDADRTVGATATHTVAIDAAAINAGYPGYRPLLRPGGGAEALSWSRYWQLELLAPDFGHALYPRAAAGSALKVKPNTSPPQAQPLIVNPPYTPRVKRLRVGYSASETIDLTESGAAPASTLYHVEPFGYRELAREDDGRYAFLPLHPNEGELYIGLADLAPPQNLALLFQLAEGSADPDVPPPAVHWSYLDGNRWSSLEHGRLLADTTSGLLNTGIITFDLPPVAPSTRLPADRYWLRATVAANSRGIADLVAIRAQAVSATFAAQGTAPEHLGQPLPPASITGLAEPQPEVRAIHQPYSSTGGKGPEQPAQFYTRVSERLRHKNRALTAWDYERLILEAFPQIYKVKCLPVGGGADPRRADQIRIIVIPDIRGKLPFDPYEPKAAADTLAQIQRMLAQAAAPNARFVVSNPRYIRLQVRLGVRFRPGYNPGFYIQALDRDLQRFLAPWAYDQSADIVLGGKINANLIVNFAEEQPYVDYVAGIKLFIQAEGDALPQQVAAGYSVAPDAILVSDRQHKIDVIAEELFQEEYFTGIDYLQIELDFTVA